MAKLSMGELEAQVMGVLWARDEWLTPGDVHRVVAASHPVTYTTVMTVLVRLWRKGRLEREKDGRAFAYHPVQSREAFTAARMRELLGAAGNRSVALSHFLSTLGSRDREQLRRLLRARRSK